MLHGTLPCHMYMLILLEYSCVHNMSKFPALRLRLIKSIHILVITIYKLYFFLKLIMQK